MTDSNGALPPDVAEVWKGAEATAKTLIEAWGIEKFRNSGVHKAAVFDAGREERMKPVRAEYVKSKQKKG